MARRVWFLYGVGFSLVFALLEAEAHQRFLWSRSTTANKKVALVATVDYPKKFYDFKAPNKLFEDWSTIYNGNYASYFRIVSADEEFNNDPWFGWPSWEGMVRIFFCFFFFAV